MIIAADLDRTLIYSERALNELGGPAKQELKPVELKNGKWIGFMTATSFEALAELCREHLFVPITTRTTDQFKRITIFQTDLAISYAVTTNGAYILENGREMIEWSEMISSKLKLETASIRELLTFLQTAGFHVYGEKRQVGNLFFYYLLENPISRADKKIITEMVRPFGWKVSQQGRKLYFIPKVISKGAALRFICEKERTAAAIGAGDSILDWDFLKCCHRRLVPLHGELVLEAGIRDFWVTKKRGILAGEEILNQCLLL